MGPIGRKRGSLFGDKKDYVIEKKIISYSKRKNLTR